MEVLSIQFVSDLHLEFTPFYYPRIKPIAENIALCGDIGSPELPNFYHFLNFLSTRFKRVFFVPGNHEYYSDTYTWDQLHDLMRNITSLWKNVYMLDNNVVNIGSYSIIGTTLWSFIPPACSDIYHSKVNNYTKITKLWPGKDFTMIRTPITLNDTNSWHSKALFFLSKQIKKARNCIILTHYPPLSDRKLNNRCKDVSMAYYNNLPELFKPNVKAWIYGHTHIPDQYIFKNTIVMSNPGGYKWEKITPDFNLKLELFLEPGDNDKNDNVKNTVLAKQIKILA